MDQPTEQADTTEKALAKEFSEYLASVSREIISPIKANVTRHQSDVDRMLSKVADARAEVESEFERQRNYLDSMRLKADMMVSESEAKLARLHSAHQSLLESSRQRIVVELKAISDNAGATVRKIGAENETTRRAIGDHHASLKQLLDESKGNTARIIKDAEEALQRTFLAHEKVFSEAVAALIEEFRSIAADIRTTTDSLLVVHDATRDKLFREFSEFGELNRQQVDLHYQSLRKEIAAQIDNKSRETVDRISGEIVDRYAEQFASMKAALTAGLENIAAKTKVHRTHLESALGKVEARLGDAVDQAGTEIVTHASSALGKVDARLKDVINQASVEIVTRSEHNARLDGTLEKIAADIVKTLSDNRVASSAELRAVLSPIRNLLIVAILFVVALAILGFALRVG